MPHLATQSRGNPEFARVIETARLDALPEFAFDIAPEPREAEAVARLLGAQAVRKLRFRGNLAPLSGGGWRLEAELGATVVQSCVVTLEPVTTRIDQRVTRRFLPPDTLPSTVDLSPEEPDDVEPLEERIDLGLVAIEALALALPDYPRKPGVSLGEVAYSADGVAPLRDADVRPFAGLAALRDKLGGGS